MVLNRIQKGSNIYVVYELDAFQSEIDKISFMMINSNQHHHIGLASIAFEEMNGVYSKMLFDVTGKVTLREYIGKHISQEDFRQMLLNLIDTIEQFDEYMIDVNQILLDMDCVYINAIDHSIAFLCIALKGVTQTYRPYEFFRAVVQNSYVNLNMNEVSYFNHIWNITSDENGFSLSNMKAAMRAADETSASSNSQPKKEFSQDTASIPSKVEEPKEITISNPDPAPVPVSTVDDVPEESKTTGLLGKLFSSSLLKKGAASEKKKSPAPSGYQGGLAGLRSGINKTGKTGMLNQQKTQSPPENVQQPVIQPNAVLTEEPQQENSKPFYQGTTVLKGKKPEYLYPPTPEVQPPVPEFNIPVPPVTPSVVPQETTVLNQNTYLPEFPEIPEPIIPGTTVLNPRIHDSVPEIPETTVLTGKNNYFEKKAAPKKTACLIRLSNHSRFFINKLLFSIGRGISDIDCAVNDNTNVSRHHADIKQYDGEYYLSAVSRTNETYLNGIRLQPEMEMKLSDGDKFRLADEEFEFRIA